MKNVAGYLTKQLVKQQNVEQMKKVPLLVKYKELSVNIATENMFIILEVK